MTTNVEKRLKQHNSGYHSYTQRYLPWKVVYIEEYATLSEARDREKYFKSAAGRRFLKKNVFSSE